MSWTKLGTVFTFGLVPPLIPLIASATLMSKNDLATNPKRFGEIILSIQFVLLFIYFVAFYIFSRDVLETPYTLAGLAFAQGMFLGASALALSFIVSNINYG